MPRFFIDFRDDDHLFEDEEGSECSDLGRAQAQAVDVLRQAVRDQVTPDSGRLFTAVVRNENGRAVYVATLEFRCGLLPENAQNGASMAEP